MADIDMKELARRGAVARVAELKEELAGIYRVFPGLRLRAKARVSREAAPAATPKRRRRRRLSAAEKKSISLRMKRYWAARKAKKG